MKTYLSKSLLFAVLSITFVNCSPQEKNILVDEELLKSLSNHDGLSYSKDNGFVSIHPESEAQSVEIKKELSRLAHESGKCGGFTESTDEDLAEIKKVLRLQNTLNNSFDKASASSPVFNKEIDDINKSLKIENLENTIKFLVAQGSRYARNDRPNKPIVAFMDHIKETLKGTKLQYTMSRVAHRRTRQDSIKVRIEGSESPESVVILGGHIDSISPYRPKEAPGADDNASGSSVILETLRAIAVSDYKPKKSLEFFWYAGEEVGLLGSKEIARTYRGNKVDVVAVMQLDMVLYPGSGDVIGLITDYTNAEMNTLTENLTTMYTGKSVEPSRCGYACSDHASWHQNGFKAVFPFEAHSDASNPQIHTRRDVINANSSMEHALKFANIAVSFLVELSSK